MLCRIVPSGSLPHRYRTNLNFVCGSLRYDVVYNLDEDSKNVFKNNVVCMILIRNVITLLRIFILLGPHRQNLSVSGTESVGTILHNTDTRPRFRHNPVTLNLNANSIQDMIEWDKEVLHEPYLTCSTTEEEL